MQLRWRPLEVPLDSPLDFIDGLYTVYGAGSSFLPFHVNFRKY